MSEIPQPGPDEIGPEAERSLESEALDQQSAQEILAIEGVDVNDPETQLQIGPPLQPTPKRLAGEFLPDEVIVGPDGREYTVDGLLKEKVVARESYLSERAEQLVSVRAVDYSFTRGLIVITEPNAAATLLTVTDVRLEADPQHDKGSRKTGVVVSCTDNAGQQYEFGPGDHYPVPLYAFSAAKRPDAIADQAEQWPQALEQSGVNWQLGDYCSLTAEPSYIGRIALIPNQEQFPGQVGVMLRDRESRSELYLVPIEDIAKPA